MRVPYLLLLPCLFGCAEASTDTESGVGHAVQAVVSSAYDLTTACEEALSPDVIPGLAAWGTPQNFSLMSDVMVRRLDATGAPTGGLLSLGRPTAPAPNSLGQLTKLRLVELPSGGAAVVASYAFVSPTQTSRYFSIWFRTIAANDALSPWELLVSENDPLVSTHASILDVGFDGSAGVVALTHGYQWGTDQDKTYYPLEIYAIPSKTLLFVRPYSAGNVGRFMGMGCTTGSCITLYAGCNAPTMPATCWSEATLIGGGSTPITAVTNPPIGIVPVAGGWRALFGGASLASWSFDVAGAPATSAPTPVVVPAGGVTQGDAVREAGATRVVWSDSQGQLVHARLDDASALLEGPTVESALGPNQGASLSAIANRSRPRLSPPVKAR